MVLEYESFYFFVVELQRCTKKQISANVGKKNTDDYEKSSSLLFVEFTVGDMIASL